MNSMNTEKLLSPKQAGEALAVHGKTVVAWALAGHLPYLRTPTGYYKFKESDVLKLLKELHDGQAGEG